MDNINSLTEDKASDNMESKIIDLPGNFVAWEIMDEKIGSYNTDSDNLRARKLPSDREIDCSGALPDEDAVISWSFNCFGEGDVGDCTTPTNNEVLDAGNELEKYVKCKAPTVAIPHNYKVVEVATLNAKYHEGEVEEKCGKYSPWTYLGFDNNCSVTVDGIKALGEYLFEMGMANVPAGNGVYFDGITVNWTEWDNCEFHQTFDQWTCEFKNNPTIHSCGASFWQGITDCSFCKDICEYRAIGVGFRYVKQVYVGHGPG